MNRYPWVSLNKSITAIKPVYINKRDTDCEAYTYLLYELYESFPERQPTSDEPDGYHMMG